MVVYHAEGAVDHSKATEAGASDPILKMWVWKPVTVPAFDGRSQM